MPAELGGASTAPLPVPAQQVVLRRALRLPVRPPGQTPRPLPVEEGDGASSTASARTASRPASSTSPAASSKLQTGYLYHYAFAMLIGVAALVTWYLFGERSDARLRPSSPVSSSCRSSALLLILCSAATARPRSATRAGSRFGTTVVTFLLSLFVWTGFDTATPASSSSRSHAWLGDTIRYQAGRRRHLDAVRHADDLPDAVLHPGLVGVDRASASRNTWSPSWCWKR